MRTNSIVVEVNPHYSKMKQIYIDSNIEMHLELLFLTVFALPNASRTGFDCNVAIFIIRMHIVIK